MDKQEIIQRISQSKHLYTFIVTLLEKELEELKELLTTTAEPSTVRFLQGRTHTIKELLKLLK